MAFKTNKEMIIEQFLIYPFPLVNKQLKWMLLSKYKREVSIASVGGTVSQLCYTGHLKRLELGVYEKTLKLVKDFG